MDKLDELENALARLEKYSDILDLDPSHAIPLAFVIDAQQSLMVAITAWGAVSVSREGSYLAASGYHSDYGIAALLGVIDFTKQELAFEHEGNPWGAGNG